GPATAAGTPNRDIHTSHVGSELFLIDRLNDARRVDAFDRDFDIDAIDTEGWRLYTSEAADDRAVLFIDVGAR
ncbi:hypothetical protein, partial [Caballeronia sp. GAFFF3]|uniref:hypothetical protein n=1 Tax=Caballeronia sp. GAFFF3 TaxID=2921759 RepID=UPI0020286682